MKWGEMTGTDMATHLHKLNQSRIECLARMHRMLVFVPPCTCSLARSIIYAEHNRPVASAKQGTWPRPWWNYLFRNLPIAWFEFMSMLLLLFLVGQAPHCHWQRATELKLKQQQHQVKSNIGVARSICESLTKPMIAVRKWTNGLWALACWPSCSLLFLPTCPNQWWLTWTLDHSEKSFKKFPFFQKTWSRMLIKMCAQY